MFNIINEDPSTHLLLDLISRITESKVRKWRNSVNFNDTMSSVFPMWWEKRNQSKCIITRTTVRASQSKENHFSHGHSHSGLLTTEGVRSPSSSVQLQSFSRDHGTKSGDPKQDEAPKNTGRQKRLNRNDPKRREHQQQRQS